MINFKKLFHRDKTPPVPNYKREETPDEWKSIGEYPETLRQRMESLYKLSEQLGQSRFELYTRIKMSFRCELIQMRPIDYDTLVKDMKSELQEARNKQGESWRLWGYPKSDGR
jgi:hypothetical protein